MWRFIVTAVGGVAAGIVGGIFLEKALKKLKEERVLKFSEIIKKNFGEPMYTNKFTLNEAKEWLVARQDKINNGYKGIVMKINKDTFSKFGSCIEIDKDLENYLLLCIFKDGSFLDTLLVRYISLDEALIDALKEEGAMVVE